MGVLMSCRQPEDKGPSQVIRPFTIVGNGNSAVTAKAGQSPWRCGATAECRAAAPFFLPWKAAFPALTSLPTTDGPYALAFLGR